MKPTVEIRFTGMPASAALEHTILEHAEKLARFHPDPLALHAVVSQPHQHHQHGNVFHVLLTARVKGQELVINHTGGERGHADPYLAVNDAFHAMRRKLTDHARVRRGEVKMHLAPAQGVVSQVSPEDGRGRLTTRDDRDLAFDREAVVGGTFEELSVGSVVEFEEDANAAEAQARTVRPTRRMETAAPV